ncbi:MAG TPA: 2OG-Fe(II) oxygenase [Acetobacteraceae bacterium]|nr:2OG-Fe(II) oxygenase [Acetobacteraceae bacterium]
MTSSPGQATEPPPFQMPAHIHRGDMAPWWNHGRHTFLFDSLSGRYIVLGFYRTAADPDGERGLRSLQQLGRFVDDGKAFLLGVSADPADQAAYNVQARFPAVQVVLDDGAMYRAYGVGAGRLWIVLDPMLRVVEMIPMRPDGEEDGRQLAALLESLPPPATFLGFEVGAPVLVLPHVFEPAFCRHLIDCHDRHGGRESGFMQEVAGKAVEQYDHAWKRRRDFMVTEEALIEQIKARFARRVGLMLQRAFQFRMTRMERYLVACYAAEDGGHFGPHRDDTVRATAHRRFAASINLNDDFEGGELEFPEFGPRRYKAPVGAAVVFSASLLHRVGTVTRGRRHAFLPFLHDEEAEKQRVANLRFLARPEGSPTP